MNPPPYSETLQVRPNGVPTSSPSAVVGPADLDNNATPPSSNQPVSESRDIPSHTNATQSTQHHPANDTLLLPKFKKNQRKIDHHNHDACCEKMPPGRVSTADIGVIAKNAIGLQGFAAINVGTRDHMEDRHKIAYGRPDGLFRAFFGVFDGHGGEEASHFTGLHLADYVEEELDAMYRNKMGLPPPPTPSNHHASSSSSSSGDEHKEQRSKGQAPYSVTEQQISSLGIDYKQALARAFDKLEEQVLRQSRHIGCRDGTTVTSVLVTHDTIYCANTGDSRTVLCRDNNAVALSTDHKPSSDDERARIVAAGGEVRAVMLDRAAFCCFKAKKVPHGAERLWPGGFSVSRAVGDIDYKDLRRKKAAVVNVLIHRPDITVNSTNPRDQFIICGSDGLWDVLTNQQAVEFVLKEVKKKKKDEPLSDISQKLADHAYSLGSEDNITALIMWFVNNDALPFKA